MEGGSPRGLVLTSFGGVVEASHGGALESDTVGVVDEAIEEAGVRAAAASDPRLVEETREAEVAYGEAVAAGPMCRSYDLI